MPTRAIFDLGIWGFLHDPVDAAVVFQLGHPEIPGIIDSFDAQQGMRLIENVLYIIFADSIAQHNKDFVVPYDMPRSAVRHGRCPDVRSG
jgi:hypothetical protein